ncbi:MAG TPA: phosphate ABC transporter ATP-binding protein PstB [Arachidicoccus soli]|uniref:Phosphate ABC transporter ATP-binding protein n=1 Tax=Arachidicoccus soli TaxID=2341117 RepID=A0A386HN23_9BACT|nr:phosphate ABC transporter ATP-binding protein PstB [Arachidicoccus soli]AYD46920.1 phosphate ABC transporter ATP-binding protein [Arachidicoccus soli]HEU0226175.1 phosphate ABC transporter ATP-binding protein PstB [Arachidicoccus soli]
MESTIIKTVNYNSYFGENHVVKNVNMEIPENNVIAVMGPSGCGKTTFLRGINRMHELVTGAHANGNIFLHKEDVMKMHPIVVRLKVGMVFQRPNPFPNLSLYDNVLAGYKLNGIKLAKSERDKIVEESLTKVALWKEVKDSLNKKGTFLSGGQQQRLCIARAVAMQPEVLLFDEPTSALDPISTATVEELFKELKKNYTLIIVTHNMQQAARVSDKTAFFYMGELVEYDDTKQMFTNPKDERTQNYITGRFS